MLKHLGQNSVGCSFQVHWLECWKSRWETFADVRLQLECSIFFRIQLVARLSKLTTYIDSWPPDSTDCRDVNIQVQKTYQGNLLLLHLHSPHSGPWGDMVIQNPLAILSSRKLNFLNAWQIPLTVYYDASAEPHSTILWIHHLYFTSYLYKQKFWNAWKFPLLYYDASACTQQSPNSWPHRSATAVDFVSNSRILPSSKTQE